MLKNLHLKLSLEKTTFKNRWDFWVYPCRTEAVTGNVLVTDKLDKKAEDELRKGGSVLLLTYGQVGKENGAGVAIGFSSFSGILHGQKINHLIHLGYYVILRIPFSMIFLLSIIVTGSGGIRSLILRQ